MKILVIEDSQVHRDSAVKTLVGHELTLADSFEKGIKALSTEINHEKLNRLSDERFGPCPSEHGDARVAWFDKRESLYDECRNRPDFDAVLVDMMMPMSHETLAPDAFYPGEQVPYGFVLALRACQVGAKYVAMVTDTNHHKGAISAALDKIGSCYYQGVEPLFEINGAKVLFIHTPFVEGGEGAEKDWGRVLKHLVEGRAVKSRTQ